MVRVANRLSTPSAAAVTRAGSATAMREGARSSSTGTATATTGPISSAYTGRSLRTASCQPSTVATAAAVLAATAVRIRLAGSCSASPRGPRSTACAVPSTMIAAPDHRGSAMPSNERNAARTAAATRAPIPMIERVVRSGTAPARARAEDHGAGRACTRPPAAAPRRPATTACPTGSDVAPPTSSPIPAGSARTAAMSGLRSFERIAQTRQSRPTASTAIP